MLPRRRGKGGGTRELLLLLVYGTCSFAATTPSSSTPSDCAPLGTLQNGVVQLSNANLTGSVANITCNNGFVVNGTCVQSTTSTCQPSGIWSIPVPECISINDGVLFNISKNPFIETFADNITMSCQPGTDLKSTSTIQSMEIRRAISTTSTWETIVTLNSTNIPIVNSSNDLATKATVSGDFTKSAKILMLTVNESLLACEDAAVYQCYVSYNDSYGKCHREINKNFDGFFFPQNVDLEVTRNGIAFESSSSTDPAQLKVGDVIDLNCTAQIGTNPNTTIEWLVSSSFLKGELVVGSIPGQLSTGSATNYHNCQYTRSSIIKHTVDAYDMTSGNFSYSCEVSQHTPDGPNTRTISANQVFHGEIYVLCPRPSAPSHGRISIEGTNISSRAFLTCDPGYVRSTGFATCMSSGLWSPTMTCDPVDCKNLTEPLDGRIIYHNSTLVNNTAEIICDDGYHLNGSTSLICEANGMWSETNSTCVPIGCKKLPPLNNGIVTLSNLTYINSTASFSCYYGYNLEGNATSTCLEEGWEYDTPVCRAIECTDPLTPNDGYFDFDNGKAEVNDTVTFSCYPGYQLVGTVTTECLVTAKWNSTTPSCVVKNCTAPPTLTNGYIWVTSYSVNSTATLNCDLGYKLIGNDTIECTENETWTIVTEVCDLIDCGTPTFNLVNGKIDVSNGTKVNNTGEIECDSGYELSGNSEISCLTNGSWSEWAGNCSLTPCGNLSKPLHGYIKSNDGFEAQFDCDVGYVLTGNSTLFCKPGGWGSSPPACNTIDCGTPTFNFVNGKIDVSNGTKVNNTGEIECDNGYELIGNSEISCLANGFWSEWAGNCSLKHCGAPKISVINGTVVGIGTKVNDTVKVECDNGYELIGKNEISCLANGSWSEWAGNCSLILCGNLPKPVHGYIKSNDGFNAQFECDAGYELSGNSTLFCKQGGWNLSPPDCHPVAIECPKQSVLKNGDVQLSNESYYQSTAQFSCNIGYNMVGRNTTECSAFGNWTNSAPSCKPVDCGNWTYTSYSEVYADITYNKDTTFDSTAISTCKNGYHINKTASSLAAKCMANGTWSVALPPICKPISCPIINVTENITVDYSDFYRLFGSKASFKCSKNGTRIQGHTEVTCLSNEEWSGSSPTCIKIEVGVTPCPEDKDFHGKVWNSTQPGTVMTKKCDQGYAGEISRQCTNKGTWNLPIYNCVREDIEKIDKEIEAIKENPSEEVLTGALDKLNNVTKPSAKANGLYGGEIEKVTSILESIATISKDVKVTNKQTESFLSTTSNLLDTSNTESWQSISQEPEASINNDQPKSKGAAKILDVVSTYTEAVASALNATTPNKTVKASNLVLHVSKIDGKKDVSFDGQKYLNLTSTFIIPKTSLTGLEHVSSVIYKNLSRIMSTTSVTNGKEDNSSKEINSGVITVNIPNWKNNKDKFKINLKLGNFQKRFSQKQCSFWNESIAAWDGRGCKMINGDTNTEETECECDHLTNFAILMSPWIQNNVDTKAIDIISIVGCSVSLLALVLTVIAHIVLWRYVKSDRVVILLNLAVALVISYAIFLGCVDRTENKDACTAVAVLLQYIYLVVFFLMLAEGIEIAVTVLYVFSTESRLKWLLPGAWLIPAVIVGISLGATQLKGYGNEQFCWLSVKGGLIWSFVAPALLIILVNFVLLILVMGAAFRTATLSQKSRSERTKTGVKCLCVLLPIMGCTWVIGIFYVNESMAWIQYVFAVCNGLQGLVIFIFHCAFNPQLRTAFQRRKKKYFDSMLSTSSSRKGFSMPRASTKSSSNSYIEMSDAFPSEDASTKRRSSREGSIARTNRVSVEKDSGAWQDSILQYQQNDEAL